MNNVITAVRDDIWSIVWDTVDEHILDELRTTVSQGGYAYAVAWTQVYELIYDEVNENN